MKKRVSIEKSPTPNGGIMQLFERDGEYSVSVNGKELMSTRRHASEEALATIACRPLARKIGAKVLIGGLGLGFTLRAALRALADDAEVVVAELMPAVVKWNRDPRLDLASDALSDKRVRVFEQDVVEVIRSGPSRYDAILLDVDNGPVGLSVKGNQRLYEEAGLKMARAALRPGGCLGIWSAAEQAGFCKRMEKAGFRVRVEKTPAHPSLKQRHALYFGWRFPSEV